MKFEIPDNPEEAAQNRDFIAARDFIATQMREHTDFEWLDSCEQYLFSAAKPEHVHPHLALKNGREAFRGQIMIRILAPIDMTGADVKVVEPDDENAQPVDSPVHSTLATKWMNEMPPAQRIAVMQYVFARRLSQFQKKAARLQNNERGGDAFQVRQKIERLNDLYQETMEDLSAANAE